MEAAEQMGDRIPQEVRGGRHVSKDSNEAVPGVVQLTERQSAAIVTAFAAR